ncbi:phage head closure protein [Enterococcus sp. BWM-S5]|uniref:Phage head closure protein n=1 Tax=Enterococcus larvae TaxID=2794352 RepID=A0ABS4CEP3_9ENTE|nr:phage head closure protein [Enterococcus larvae]MBP1044848.1 phage head closure protein [Enterococcus larvae]
MSKIASYSRPVQFYVASDYTTDKGGNLVPTWTEQKKKWCNVRDVISSSKEKEGSAATLAIKRVRLAMRYNKDIDNSMSFDFEGDFYSIVSVGDPVGDRKELIVFGEVLANGGRL